ncbi:MAG: ATPase, T2SS/T4P/T4SS family [Candidatus Hydrogenedentota bacterium]
MDQDAKAGFLRQVAFFRDFEHSAIDHLAAAALLTTFDAGQAIIKEGDIDSRLFILVSGHVGIYRMGADGAENVITYFNPPHVVGEFSLFDDAPRSASVKALDRAEALVVRKEDLMEVILKHPQSTLGIFRALTRHIRESTDIINAMMSQQGESGAQSPLVVGGLGAGRVQSAEWSRAEDEAFGVYLVSEGLLERPQMIVAMNRALDAGSPLPQVLIRMKMIDSVALSAAESRFLRMKKARAGDPSVLLERLEKAGFLVPRRAEELRAAKVDSIIDTLKAELSITDEDVLNIMDLRDMSFARVNEDALHADAVKLIPAALADEHRIIPLQKIGNTLCLGMISPSDAYAREMAFLATGLTIEPCLLIRSNFKELREAMRRMTEDKGRSTSRSRASIEILRDLAGLVTRQEVGGSQAIPLLEGILRSAIRTRASDIHIEPQEGNTRVRFRIDGILNDMLTLPAETHVRVVSSLKAASEMDIANRLVPQDGKTVYDSAEGKYMIRVSTLPTALGEKVVMRLHKESDVTLGLRDLGLTEKQHGLLTRLSKSPYGMVLVTGPVGSGKTTTLYSILHSIDVLRNNIVTIEDPIEYELPGLNHVAVNPKAGLTYVAGLRSILRQDPDVIMLGEIRDKETGQIAVRAACTGVLMLTTLHTNDAPSAVTALLHMGVEPFFIVNALLGVVAQRLVRVVCGECAETYQPDTALIAQMGLDPSKEYHFKRPVGCPTCGHSGYRGRIGIFEIMMMTPKLRDLVLKEAPESEIRAVAMEEGMISLRRSAVIKVVEGVSTVEELLRKTAEVEESVSLDKESSGLPQKK